MELNENQLENAIGGNSQHVGEEVAKRNPEYLDNKKLKN